MIEKQIIENVEIAKRGMCRCGISTEDEEIKRITIHGAGKVCVCDECLKNMVKTEMMVMI